MNSEELELSLRTEFESYLNSVRAEMKKELADFQKMVESEAAKHKAQLDEAFKSFSACLDSDSGLDEALKESVVEHLRLARDDGAQLAASAAAEAERILPSASGSFNEICDAIAEISSKTSQSAILKSLTDHCSRFTARGAFFIIKNDNFVGWQVFGKDTLTDDHTARDIHFSVSSDTILKASIQELQTVEATTGSHKHDAKFLKSLKFGDPEKRFAVPLIARGRGVAVLYADGGMDGEPVQVEAIESLVRVAGLTVELLASSTSVSRPQTEEQTEEHEQETASPTFEAQEEYVPEPVYAAEEVFEATEEFSAEPAFEEVTPVETVETSAFESFAADAGPAQDLTDTVPVVVQEELDDESYLMTEPVDSVVEVEASYEGTVEVAEDAATEFSFATSEAEVQQQDEVHVIEEEVVPVNGNGNYTAEPVVETSPPAPTNGRRRGRNIDLPIEVSEDERDKHTRARSFARLLVSEIKLYNPDKVSDGRASNDLYDRLREAIDRSREMYNQRVDAPVSTRFDYFHYELVNGLAEGDEARLGSSYPGARS